MAEHAKGLIRPAGGFKPGDFAIIGFHQNDIEARNLPEGWPEGVEAVEKVVRVRMFFEDCFVDEDFTWPEVKLVEDLVSDMVPVRMEELKKGVHHKDSTIVKEQSEQIRQDHDYTNEPK